MFRQDSTAEAAFRQEVRAWLEANLPLPLRGRTFRPPPAELMPWYRKLYERGWVAPHWPKAHGGMGASLREQIVLAEELARISGAAASGAGLNHLGPILMKFGTEEQKAGTCRRSCAAMSSGRKAIPSRARAPTSQA